MTTAAYKLDKSDFDGTVFHCLVGQTVERVDGLEKGSEECTFTLAGGGRVRFFHDRDCCETVEIEDVCGDVSDLIGAPLVQAEEVSGECKADEESFESATWTFYKFATTRGSVTVRWLGESNGCYCEDVACEVAQ